MKKLPLITASYDKDSDKFMFVTDFNNTGTKDMWEGDEAGFRRIIGHLHKMSQYYSPEDMKQMTEQFESVLLSSL